MRFSKLFLLGFGGLLCLFACEEPQEQFSVVTEGQARAIKNVPIDALVLLPNEGLVYYQDQPFTGNAVGFSEGGIKTSSIDYYQGKKQGKYLKWFEDGKISFDSEYADGKRHGVILTWWRNGNLRSKSNYVNGIAEGLQQQWYASGAKFKRINLVAGEEEGLQQSWRENGKLYNNYEAKNGRIFGLKRAKLCYELDDESLQIEIN